MNEADEQPFGNKLGLARDHEIEEHAIPVPGVHRFRVVPRNDVVGEMANAIHITANREELKGADANMARRHAGQDGTGQRRLAPNGLAGRHG